MSLPSQPTVLARTDVPPTNAKREQPQEPQPADCSKHCRLHKRLQQWSRYGNTLTAAASTRWRTECSTARSFIQRVLRAITSSTCRLSLVWVDAAVSTVCECVRMLLLSLWCVCCESKCLSELTIFTCLTSSTNNNPHANRTRRRTIRWYAVTDPNTNCVRIVPYQRMRDGSYTPVMASAEPPPLSHTQLKQLLASCGRHPETNIGTATKPTPPTRERKQLDIWGWFHNAQGMSGEAFRREYLGSLRRKYHFGACAETFARPCDEQQWQRAWGSTGQTYWASGSATVNEYTDQHRSEPWRSCGVALFFSDRVDVSDDTVVHRDASGRCLVVSCTLYARHKMLFVVSHAPNEPTAQARYFANLRNALFDVQTDEPKLTDLHQRTIVWMGDFNCVPNSAVDASQRASESNAEFASYCGKQNASAGAVAMRSLAAKLNVEDAFRSLHPDANEYTHCETSHGRARRIDAVHVSSSATRQHALPALLRCKHIHHTDPQLALHHKSKKSDSVNFGQTRSNNSSSTASEDRHAAVALQIRLSEKHTPPKQWRFHNDSLLHASNREALRSIIHNIKATVQTATEQLQTITSRVRQHEQQRAQEEKKAASLRKKNLYKKVARMQNNLGQGLGGNKAIPSWMAYCPPTRRAHIQNELSRARAELAVLLANEHSDAILQQDHDEYLEDKPTRKHFADRRTPEPGSHTPVEAVKAQDGSMIHDQNSLLASARAFFRERFNKAYDRDASMRDARTACLAAVSRKLPETVKQTFSVAAILSEDSIRAAIADLARNKCPGSDGLTAEFYQCYIDDMAPILAACYKERLAAGTLTDTMNEAVVSLLYKLNGSPIEEQQRKGGRESWNNYRPVSCLNLDYKIFAKAVTQKLETAMPFVICAEQLGFQKGKYIGEATMLAQLLATRCAAKKIPGIAMLVDGEKAYDLVQHDWLREVMAAMNFPPEFIELTMLMYAAPTSKMKVNGWQSASFKAANAVRQGCPASCYLYIMSMEPLLAMLEKDDNLRGISIPGPDGRGTREVRFNCFADDLMLYLNSFDQLKHVKRIMQLYERASGAATNWNKTVGIRLGTLNGATPAPSDDVPPDMATIAWHDSHTEQPQRYLGVWLGSEDAVQSVWARKVSAKLLARIHHNQKRRPATWRGRAGTLKTLCFSTAVYHILNQHPKELHALITEWQSEAWRFHEATAHGERAAAERGDAVRTQALVRRVCAIQKPENGGSAALDVQRSVDALRLTWILRLLDPSPQPWKGLIWEHVHEQLGWLHQGERAIMSALPIALPPGGSDSGRFWRSVLGCWNALPAPQKSDAERAQQPAPESVLAQPLWGNTLLPASVTIDAKTARAFATRGITHMRDLLRYVTAVDSAGADEHTCDSIRADGILFRALREDEFPGEGLQATNPNGSHSVKDCIERGSLDVASCFVHATHDLAVAAHFALSRANGARTVNGSRSSRHIVAIDARKLPALCALHDLSTAEGRLAHGLKPKSRAWELSKGASEVCISGLVPANAIIGVLNANKLGIRHRTKQKQTYEEFKQSTSAAARLKMRAWAQEQCTKRALPSSRQAEHASWPTVTTPANKLVLQFDRAAFRAAHCTATEGSTRQQQGGFGRCVRWQQAACACARCVAPDATLLSTTTCTHDPCAVIDQLLLSVPETWLPAIYTREQPLRAGEWVEVRTTAPYLPSQQKICKVETGQLFLHAKTNLAVHERGATNALLRTSATWNLDPDVHSTRRCRVRTINGVPHLAGYMDDDRVDLSEWALQCNRTLQPTQTTNLASAEAHDFYDMLVALRFQPPTALRSEGLWHGLLLTAEDNDVGGAEANDIENEQLDEMRDVLAATKSCKWLTRRQQQTLYATAVDALPIGRRVGDGADSLDDLLFEDAIARSFWDMILSAWCSRVEDQDWAAFSLQHARSHGVDDLTKRAIALGMRPTAQDECDDAWHVLRACAIEALVDAHRAKRIRDEDANANDISTDEAALTAYAACRKAFQATLLHAHRAAADNEQHNLAAAHRKQQGAHDRMRLAWDAAFLATTIATNDSGVRQTLLPPPPMVTNTAAAPIVNTAHARNTLKRINTNPPQQLPPNTRVIYTDGSGPETGRTRSGDMPAGWGFVVLRGGDGDTEPNAVEAHRECGKVIVNEPSHPDSLGADRPTNNTAELSAIAHALRYALSDPSGPPVLIRFDSKYAARMATGRGRSRTNKALVRSVQRLWQRTSVHLRGNLWCKHVYGHSDHAWNDRADELARLGKRDASGRSLGRRRRGDG